MSKDDSVNYGGNIALRVFIFFYFSTIGLFLPYLPLFFRQNGLSSLQIGILFSMGPLVTIAIQPLWGFLSDRFKTVKKLIILQLIVTAILSFLVFRVTSFELLLPTLFMFNVFAFPIIPLMDSLTLSSIKNSRGTHYGSFRLWGSLGFGFSALLFGIFFRAHDLTLFPICYSLLLILCLCISFFLSDSVYVGRKAGLKDIKRLVSSRKVFTFLLLTALLSSTNRANDAFIGIFIKQLGGQSDTVGYAWTVAALSEVPVLALGGVLLTRFSELKLLTVAAGVFALRWTLLGITPDPGLIILIQLTHSISFGLFFLCSVSYMSKMTPDRLRATAQGMLAAFLGGVAGIAGSVLGGAIMSNLGARTLYFICALVALAACFFYYFRERAEEGANRIQETEL